MKNENQLLRHVKNFINYIFDVYNEILDLLIGYLINYLKEQKVPTII